MTQKTGDTQAPTLRGVYPIVVTPFHDDGTVDYASLDRLVEYLLEQGAHGLGLFGNASEGYTLLAEERTAMLTQIVRRVNGRVPLVASSGHTGTLAAAALSREAQDLGADALMVLPPYLLKPDGEGLMVYFDAISKAVSIPIMVQDAPLMTQVAMPAALLARMAREIENVRSAKVEAPPTAPKIAALRQALGESGGGFAIFGGLNGQFLIEEFERGAAGIMPSSDITSTYVAIWNHLERGEKAAAWRKFTEALPLIRYELQPGLGVSAAKHNLAAAGVIRSAAVRHPTQALNAAGLAELAVIREMHRAHS
ncbi:MAG: dihydrodipicolinate synthase family protein [Acidobacteria bacterium]|nr:dihydrodipicolinate synthase family protein [Acidobacteriota bacterium]